MLIGLSVISLIGCGEVTSQQKEQILQERTQNKSMVQSGIPSIKNFREKKVYKEIYELRDQDDLTTYTYIVAKQTGKLVFIGESVGFPIPYDTQYNNPSQLKGGTHEYTAYPQAEPSGLYSSKDTNGIWIMMVDKKTQKPRPVYFEEPVICSTFLLEQ